MKLYRNEIRVTVLSRREISDGEALSLTALAQAADEVGGDCIGDVSRTIVNTPMTPAAMIQALVEAGADPDYFFSIDGGVPTQDEMVSALGDMPPLGKYMIGRASLDTERFAADLVDMLEKRRAYENDPPF